MPISTGLAWGLPIRSIRNMVIYEVVVQKYNKPKKQYDKDQQTIKSFDNLYRRNLQDTIIDKSENESLYSIFTK